MGSTTQSCKGKWFVENLSGISEGECKLTSKSTWDYNCVGYATGDFLWWHPEEQDEHYWPDGITRDFQVTTYEQALTTVGFEPCLSSSTEVGYDKIAIFHRDGEFSHVSVIVSETIWQSKLGEYEDLEHPPSPNEMGKYGLLFSFMRRVAQRPTDVLPEIYRI